MFIGERMIRTIGNKRFEIWGFVRKVWCQHAHHCCSIVIMLGLLTFTAPSGHADTPVTLYRSFAGNINITGTGGTLRTSADPSSWNVTNSGTMQLLGVPAGSTIVAAYLYWAGSGGDPVGGAAADYNVTFKGTNITADAGRTYTASYNNGGTDTLYFFSGVKDVTSMVTGNGTYTFSNLAVQNANINNGGQYRADQAVLSAFALVVIYSNPSETLHVVNLWEGLQTFHGGAITLTPSNFQVPTPAPATALSSRHLVLTWEGDSGNSGSSGGYNEALTFCAPAPCTGTALSDAYNPTNNQFNSTVDMPPNGPFSGVNTTWGVDLDMYDVTSLVHAGNSSAQAVYSSGADLVLLANQTMSIANVAVADLRLTKTHSGSFPSGGIGTLQLNVHNNGPSTATGTTGNPITVTDTIPAGLTYLSSSGTGWTVNTSSLPTVKWTYVGTLASGADLPAITLQVRVTAAVGTNITNTASVSGHDFDHIMSNNTSSDPVTVVLLPPLMTVVKSANSPTVKPGDVVTYTVQVTNSGNGGATSVVAQDQLSPYVSWGLYSYPSAAPANPFLFTDGATPSNLNFNLCSITYYNGTTWSYMPSSGGGGAPSGYDANVKAWKIDCSAAGTMNAGGAFTINYKAKVK